jgi:hypothetical protein
MRNPNRDNGGPWLMVLVGGVLVYFSYAPFLTYLQTGEAFRRHDRNIRFDLYGGDAALFDGICILIGVFLIAAGLRKLLFTK